MKARWIYPFAVPFRSAITLLAAYRGIIQAIEAAAS
jgi:hypothetical protein